MSNSAAINNIIAFGLFLAIFSATLAVLAMRGIFNTVNLTFVIIFTLLWTFQFFMQRIYLAEGTQADVRILILSQTYVSPVAEELCRLLAYIVTLRNLESGRLDGAGIAVGLTEFCLKYLALLASPGPNVLSLDNSFYLIALFSMAIPAHFLLNKTLGKFETTHSLGTILSVFTILIAIHILHNYLSFHFAVYTTKYLSNDHFIVPLRMGVQLIIYAGWYACLRADMNKFFASGDVRSRP